MSGALAGVLLQGVEPDAVASGALVFLVSLLVGTVAISLSAQLLVDRDTGVVRAAVTALVGALVYTLVGVFLGWIPLLGPVLMLLAWVGVINWQYPGGWGTAIGIGVVAWASAVLVLFGLAQTGFVAPDAMGIPGT